MPLSVELRELIAIQTGVRPRGPIRLLTQLRHFGYFMSPLNLFYVFDECDRHVEFIVAEVNNTPWNERHCYVLWDGNRIADDNRLCFAHAHTPGYNERRGPSRHEERDMETIRTFIAIELDPALRSRLGELQDRLREDLPPRLVRWVRPEGIHLTLKFLGEVPVAQVTPIGEAMRRACAGHAPFSFTLGGIGCFPNARRPRVVWVGVEEPTGALAQLQGDVERALQALGHPRERRGFAAHLTLGRVRGRDREAVEALGTYVTRARVRVGRMEVGAVRLIRSQLLPGGAVYTTLDVAPLEGVGA